jgi:hypothetical protein
VLKLDRGTKFLELEFLTNKTLTKFPELLGIFYSNGMLRLPAYLPVVEIGA